MNDNAVQRHRTRDDPSAPALVLSDAIVPFGHAIGLYGVNVSLAHGERLALLGPSGSGKTTLLRAIAGLDDFSAGTLRVNGVDMTRAQPEQRGVVYLHQTPALFPHLSVRDNVAFPMRLRGQNRQTARAAATAILESMHLHALADRFPDGLSGGERHRTALARALAATPHVLLLDEPFAALDPALRNEIRSEVLAVLTPPGSPAAIVVTHDIDEATMFGNRIAVLLDRQIAQCDAASTVVRAPATLAVAQFLGVPNRIHGFCKPSDDNTCIWESAIGTSIASVSSGHYAAVGWADMLLVLPPVESGATERVPGSTETSGSPVRGAAGIVIAVEHRGMGNVVRVQLSDTVVVGLAEPNAQWLAGDRVTVALRTRLPHLLPLVAETPMTPTTSDSPRPGPSHV